MATSVTMRRRVCLLEIILLLAAAILVHPVSAAENSPPIEIENLAFNPTWNLDISDSYTGNLGVTGFGVSFDFSYSFDAGVSLPVTLSVAHPKYILPDTSSVLNISAKGDDSARAWAYASGSFHANLDAGLLGSYNLVDKSINAGDEVNFVTPLGTQNSQTLDADIELGSQTINLILTSTTIELKLRVSTRVITSTSLSTHLSMKGDALTTPVDEELEWSSEDTIHSIPFSVNDQTGTYVDMSFEEVSLYLQALIFTITAFTVYLVIDGSTVGSITIPVPGLDFVVAGQDSIPETNGFFHILADASGTTRDLGSKLLSIYVGIPMVLPSFLSPGFLLMIIPAAVGITYGRKKDNGSKALGSILLLIVLLGAALGLGLQLTAESGFDSFLINWMTLAVPVFAFTGDFVSFFMTYLPWMLGGLAVGGATKRPKTGALLAFGIPFVLFLLTNYLVAGISGLTAITSMEVSRNILVSGTFAACFGAIGGSVCRTGNN